MFPLFIPQLRLFGSSRAYAFITPICLFSDPFRLAGSKFRKQIGLEVFFVLLACGVLQMLPRRLLALVADGPHCFLVAREKVGLVVPLIDALHELVPELGKRKQCGPSATSASNRRGSI